MRLWSLHPRYLDAKGLVALWREGLLAKAVLQGNRYGGDIDSTGGSWGVGGRSGCSR